MDFATFISLSGAGAVVGPGVSAEELFDDGEQLLDACAELGLSIGGVMRAREQMLIGAERAEAEMRRVVEAMSLENSAPIERPQR